MEQLDKHNRKMHPSARRVSQKNIIEEKILTSPHNRNKLDDFKN
jgi:hypothetical protein